MGEQSVWESDVPVIVLNENNRWVKARPVADRIHVPIYLNLNPFTDLKIPKTVKELILIENFEGKFGAFGRMR